ncbi:hypothetical protein PORY_000661 [Pneumocystis oryctolagi]|uniref:Uncharacterized protein n=1 Tax=Pneumocystis oryctolagi TaxID=42067 RepID=A0ACB7CDM6_9ASCO|nr:hypothetical protein PORY_000661 [Pneumocystis oryctolagi]
MSTPSHSSSENTFVRTVSRKNGEKWINKGQTIQKQRCPPNVLEEDEYQQAISDIIKRDFFPDLLEMEANEKMEEKQRLEMIQKTGDNTSENVLKQREDEENTSEILASDKLTRNMSLDKFQAMYTSEDNASFMDILNEQNKRRRHAYEWAWNNNNKINSARVNEESRRAMLKDSNTHLIGWVDDRPSQPEAWPFNPMNGLMFHPETDYTKPKVLLSEDEKSIAYHATRMPPIQLERVSSPSLSTIEKELNEKDDEPRVAGWSFVDDAPSPSPEVLKKPRLTWGETASTPLQSSETFKRAFKMQDIPEREVLHHRITEQLKKKSKAKTPSLYFKEIPKFSSSPDLRKAMLSPGGRLLLAASGRYESGIRNDLKTPRITSLLRNVSTVNVTPRAA